MALSIKAGLGEQKGLGEPLKKFQKQHVKIRPL